MRELCMQHAVFAMTFCGGGYATVLFYYAPFTTKVGARGKPTTSYHIDDFSTLREDEPKKIGGRRES